MVMFCWCLGGRGKSFQLRLSLQSASPLQLATTVCRRSCMSELHATPTNNSVPSTLSLPTCTGRRRCHTSYLITHADESRGSKAFTRVCLCVLFVRKIEPKRLKYKITKCHRDSPSWVLATHFYQVKRSKVKVTVSQSAKYIEGDRMAGVSLHSVEWPPSIVTQQNEQI